MQIAILGCGVVGGGVAALLEENASLITAHLGRPVTVKYILERREMPDSPFLDKIVKDYDVIVNDPEVELVVEAMGGSYPAFPFSMRALEAGKHVVTSNKEVVANFGDQLLAAASLHGVQYLFEASVGGGIPVLRPLAFDLAGNQIDRIAGILNGTTNYILTRMFEAGAAFPEALAEAQAKGYAEADPTADIEGMDACRKIAILAAIATGTLVKTERIHTEGITKIRSEDVASAARAGYSIKLLGRMVKESDGNLYLMVAPFLIPASCPLANVSDVFNGVLVRGNFVDDVMFYGRGAGAKPTASAMVSDVVAIAFGAKPIHKSWTAAAEGSVTDFDFFVSRHYLAIKGLEGGSASVILGEGEAFETEEGLCFFTAPMSEKEYEDRFARLTACGAEVLSHIRIYE